MAQESCAKAHAFMRTLDQARNVGQHEAQRADAHHAQDDQNRGPPDQQPVVDRVPQADTEDQRRERREYNWQRGLDKHEAHALAADVLGQRVLGGGLGLIILGRFRRHDRLQNTQGIKRFVRRQ